MRMSNRFSTPLELLGPNGDGLADPTRASIKARLFASSDRLSELRARRASRSPLIRELQAASDRATGGR